MGCEGFILTACARINRMPELIVNSVVGALYVVNVRRKGSKY